jgi:class 3 adenylate cyclase
LAHPAGTIVMSAATADALSNRPPLDVLGEQQVKGREASVLAFRLTK